MNSNWMAAAAAVIAVSFIAPMVQAKPIIIAEGAHGKSKSHYSRYRQYPDRRYEYSRQHESWRGGDRDYEYRRALRQMR